MSNSNLDYLKEAVDDAIADCIRNHVLEEFFRSRKDEVRKVTHLDYTWEKREKLIRKEEYEEGVARGIQALIETCKELNVSKAKTVVKVTEKFQVSEEDSLRFVEKYWE